jgi:site-specific DNA-cytosine methylase
LQSDGAGKASGSGGISNSTGEGLERRPILGRGAIKKLASLERANRECGGQWATEPSVGRVAHGISNRVDRLRGLGNAVVPQVAEFIGSQIVRHHNERCTN